MASMNGVRVVSVLEFPDRVGEYLRYEILQGINTPEMWGFNVYLLKEINAFLHNFPYSSQPSGESDMFRARVWILIKSSSCENVTTREEAEAFIDRYHRDNWLTLAYKLSTK
ncbi:hypothetical protein [Klebsiella pneumoniae]